MPGKPDIAYLYVLGTEDGPCKVGYSLAPEQRIKNIQRGRKERIVTVGQWPLGRSIALSVERYIHWQLRDSHIRGEWFNATQADILATIENALNKKGEIDAAHPIPPIDKRGRPHGLSTEILKRMDVVRDDGEDRTAFVRAAVERELKRRERAKG